MHRISMLELERVVLTKLTTDHSHYFFSLKLLCVNNKFLLMCVINNNFVRATIIYFSGRMNLINLIYECN